ncbi:DUF917 domain-containing protein [Croceicoccus ponticola]|uniref:DUF917 domain-containing protein n=1 Tax=Croceicoccus ponticola TaxID=2217664 RepID=A0A437GY26_9SPHN|nr:DUF917 domain-containing protein [Croceicoccus ponticola]RVQ66366.1 DUF917 domain-containing protein [Croceicoccus ponticola]
MLIDVHQIDDLACGAAFLGSGGGGDPYYGTLLAKAAIERLGPIPLLPLADLDDDALVVPCGWIGAPTVSVEKLPNGREAVDGLRKLEEIMGRKIGAVMPIEIGGGNGLAHLIAAAELGLPVADADGMGRAFPESQMAIFNICGLSACPSVITGADGSLRVIDTPDNLEHERIARAISIEMGGIAHMVEYPLTGRQAKDHAIAGSFSAAIAAGAAIRQARAQKADPIAALAGALAKSGLYPFCDVLIDGKIVDLQRETRDGFSVGRVIVSALTGDRTLEIEFQNENLCARERDGTVRAMVPDLISILDRETADTITTERLAFGQRVKVVAAAAPARLRESHALTLVGPAAFGFSETYVPVEILNNWENAAVV